MTLAIAHGDLLVIGSNEYAIRYLDEWTDIPSRGFDRMASTVASTKTTSAGADGQLSTAVGVSAIKIFPLMPLDENVRDLVSGIASPATLRQTFVRDGANYYLIVVEVPR